MGVPISWTFFPFIPAGNQSNQNVFNQDVIINEAYPGIVFEPLEPNSTAQVIREVSGAWWFVTNADWNAQALQWQQNPPDNPANPAYAMVLGNDGSWTRYYANATNAVNTAVSWIQLSVETGTGLVSHTPKQQTSNTGNAFSIAPNWAVTSAVQMGAFFLNVTDVSSMSNSFLEAFNVNGVTKWEVRKDGTLVVGIVPASAIVGPFNNATFTGTSTFNGPVVMNNGLSVAGGESVTGGLTVDSFHDTGNATIDGTLSAGATTVSSLHDTGNATIDGTETVNGLLTANGGIDTTDINASGTITADNIQSTGGGAFTFTFCTCVTTTTQLGPTTGSVNVRIPRNSAAEVWEIDVRVDFPPLTAPLTWTFSPDGSVVTGPPLMQTSVIGDTTVRVTMPTATGSSYGATGSVSWTVTGGTIAPANYSGTATAFRTA